MIYYRESFKNFVLFPFYQTEYLSKKIYYNQISIPQNNSTTDGFAKTEYGLTNCPAEKKT